MRISPLDIRKQAFKKSMRGVDAEEVRIFLELVASEYEKVLQENAMMAEKIRYQEERLGEYHELEKSMRNSLVTADRIASESRDLAERDAQRLVQEGQMRAERILEDARERLQALIREIESLRGKKEIYVRRFWSLLESQFGVLQEHGPDMAEVDQLRQRVEQLMQEGRERAAAAAEAWMAPPSRLEDPAAGPAPPNPQPAPPAVPSATEYGPSRPSYAPAPRREPSDARAEPSRPEPQRMESPWKEARRMESPWTEAQRMEPPAQEEEPRENGRQGEPRGGIVRSLGRLLRGNQGSLPLSPEETSEPGRAPEVRNPESPDADARGNPAFFRERERREGVYEIAARDENPEPPNNSRPPKR